MKVLLSKKIEISKESDPQLADLEQQLKNARAQLKTATLGQKIQIKTNILNLQAKITQRKLQLLNESK
jgi:hypothetical protein